MFFCRTHVLPTRRNADEAVVSKLGKLAGTLSTPNVQYVQSSSNGTWALGVNNTVKWPQKSNFILTTGGSNVAGLIANTTYSIG